MAQKSENDGKFMEFPMKSMKNDQMIIMIVIFDGKIWEICDHVRIMNDDDS